MNEKMSSFHETLTRHGLRIGREPLEILQVNLGKLCNQACHHCHVDAGPKRTEIMEKNTIDRLIELMDRSPTLHTVDLTGGAPELNPDFRTLVVAARKRNIKVIDRCNLTVLFEHGQEDTAQFLREHRVSIVASLPCYSKDAVEKQRGHGVFDKSIRALRLLNDLGYGSCAVGEIDSTLTLDLVYNPLGPSLPPPQEKLEAVYKKELKDCFGIDFNRLYTITNMPIKRFLDQLARQNKHEEYMELLIQHFNPQVAMGVMCRTLMSVGWDGRIYDCDFNQMLDMPMGGIQTSIWDVESFDEVQARAIAFDRHCYGCTAGAGSSCGGALT